MADAPVNRREIRVIGMSRSGNHAIMQWITAQQPGRWLLLNCCEGKQNPFTSARPLPGGDCSQSSYSHDVQQERPGSFSSKELLIFNHEDSFLAHACSDEYEQRHDEWVGPSEERIDLLLLRDPFNLFASRFNRRGYAVKVAAALRIWKQHARQFLGDINRLTQRPVLVSYDHWFCDREYRRRLAADLGLPGSDAGLQRVATCFGGSSFDGLDYDGRAQQMPVLTRWQRLADDPTFASIFDEQTIELARRAFGDIDEIAPWLEAETAVRARGAA